MLVDLARNDLSRMCDEVEVAHYQAGPILFSCNSLVSEVTGKVRPDTIRLNCWQKLFLQAH